MSFENQISEKLGRHNPHEIEQLILDGFFKAEKFTEDHKNTLEKYTSLIHCSLGNFGLTSLENFPKLDTIQILELNKNKLTGEGLDTVLKNCPELYKIKLEDNNIENLDNLKCLANYKIKKINLKGNPIVTSVPNYRDELFKIAPSLESVDDLNREGQEVESTDYNGEEDDGEYDDEDGDDIGGEDDEEFDEDNEDDGGDEDDEGEDEDDDDDEDDEKPQKKKK